MAHGRTGDELDRWANESTHMLELSTSKGTDSISYVEAEGVAAAATIPAVDIASRRLEVLTAPFRTPNTRRRISMRLPTLKEAQTLGVKRPIAEGTADSFNNETAGFVDEETS